MADGVHIINSPSVTHSNTAIPADLKQTEQPCSWQAEQGPMDIDCRDADWSNHRVLQLDITASRQTGAVVELHVIGTNDTIIGQAVFTVDWSGPNAMSLWLAQLRQQAGDVPVDWSDVRKLRLTCTEDGLWPTQLHIDAIRISAQSPTWPVNESDTIIDMGWRAETANPTAWQVAKNHTPVNADETPGVRAGSVARHFGTYCTTISYQQSATPGQLTVERHFDLDVSGQRELLGKTGWDSDCELTAIAIVDDGREILLHDRGNYDPTISYWAFGADLQGAKRLRSIRLTLTEKTDRQVTGRTIGLQVFWFLLRRATPLDDQPVETVQVRLQRPDALHDDGPTTQLSVRQTPSPNAESTTPIGDPLTDGLPFGFLLSRTELPTLRQSIQHGRAARLFAQMQCEADQSISTELVDRNFYGTDFGGSLGHPKGLRGAGIRLYAPNVAAIHLLTGEARYAEAARRWVLRAARSDDWRADHGGHADRPYPGPGFKHDSFIGSNPKGFAGSTNHHFFLADVAFGVVTAYDMLYHCFNDSEKREVEAALANLGAYGLYDVLRKRRFAKIKSNQGLLFALPLLMQAAFLRQHEKADPVFERMYEWALTFMLECGTRIWNREGVCGEGPGYGGETAMQYLDALRPIAACMGKTPEQIMPPGLRETFDYLLHCSSTWWTDHPRYLGLADLSFKCTLPAGMVAYFAGFEQRKDAQQWWKQWHDQCPQANLITLQALAAWDQHDANATQLGIASNTALTPQPLPPVKIYRDQPMAFLRTGCERGDTLVSLSNMREWTGHGHCDRGSVIFEFNGEALVLDPGNTIYSSPDFKEYVATPCHSTLSFAQRSQWHQRPLATAIAGDLSTSGDTCPGHRGGIDWVAADASAAYPEADQFIRHLFFLRPNIVVLFDEVMTIQPEPMELNFTCLGPLSIMDKAHNSETTTSQTFASTTLRNRLLIHTQANTPLTHTFKQWGTTWPTVPSYRLIQSTTAAQRSCYFLTVLAPHAIDAPSPIIQSISTPGGLGVRVTLDDASETIVCHEGIPGRERNIFPGVQSDARVVVMRHYQKQLRGALMLHGTRLAVPDMGDCLTSHRLANVAGIQLDDGSWNVYHDNSRSTPTHL